MVEVFRPTQRTAALLGCDHNAMAYRLKRGTPEINDYGLPGVHDSDPRWARRAPIWRWRRCRSTIRLRCPLRQAPRDGVGGLHPLTKNQMIQQARPMTRHRRCPRSPTTSMAGTDLPRYASRQNGRENPMKSFVVLRPLFKFERRHQKIPGKTAAYIVAHSIPPYTAIVLALAPVGADRPQQTGYRTGKL